MTLFEAKKGIQELNILMAMVPHTILEEEKFCNFGRALGCKGFGLECINCIAIECVKKIIGQKKDVAGICSQVIQKTGNRYHWNGKIIDNPFWLRDFWPNPRVNCKKYLVSYESDISFWTPFQIAETYEKAFGAPKHSFYFLTKDPKTFLRKSEEAFKLLKVDITSLKEMQHISICTSVGINKVLYRINELREFLKFGFPLEVWFKPVLEYMPRINLKNINVVRINVEKGQQKRDWNPKWLIPIVKAARKYSSSVKFDMRSAVLNFKRTVYVDRVNELTGTYNDKLKRKEVK